MSLTLKTIIVALAVLLGFAIDASTIQSYIAFSLILIFGIPHGATDHALHNLMQKNKIDSVPDFWFLLFYLGIIFIYALVWYLVPVIAFTLFIIVSAYHFGETQLLDLKGKEFIKVLTFFFWGLSVLLIVFYPHLEEVSSIISPYIVSEVGANWLIEHYIKISIPFLVLTIIGILILDIKKFPSQIAELILLFILSKFTSLFLAFGVFFAFWHSRDATFRQINRISNKIGEFSFLQWIKLALPYTVVSLIGIAIILGLSTYGELQLPSITLFFILIALITMPHVIVMASFYRN